MMILNRLRERPPARLLSGRPGRAFWALYLQERRRLRLDSGEATARHTEDGQERWTENSQPRDLE